MRILLTLSLVGLFTSAFAQNYKTQIVVAQDGSGDHTSIQEAIDATKAFPDEPIIIYIKAGVYTEKVRVYSWNTNLSIIGDSTGQTVITYGDYFKSVDLGRNSTFHTYTFKVEANDFYAKNLIIENSAGPVGQAVALHVEGDRVQFENCEFKGYQDTMYLAGENSRQYFKNCLIVGSTDFIFGEATVVFEECEIHSLSDSYITAASTPQGVEYGFILMDCKLTAKEDVTKVYLGRPWRKYAKTVFLNCEMGAHIRPEGWKEWSNKEDLGTTFYAEYKSRGEGAGSDFRINWSNQLTDKEAREYSIENIFNGWKPN